MTTGKSERVNWHGTVGNWHCETTGLGTVLILFEFIADEGFDENVAFTDDGCDDTEAMEIETIGDGVEEMYLLPLLLLLLTMLPWGVGAEMWILSPWKMS